MAAQIFKWARKWVSLILTVARKEVHAIIRPIFNMCIPLTDFMIVNVCDVSRHCNGGPHIALRTFSMCVRGPPALYNVIRIHRYLAFFIYILNGLEQN